MTVVNKTVPLAAVSGGTISLTRRYCSAVQLTPTRMVVAYNQTNPARRVFSIVDSPGGFKSVDNPTVQNAVYNDGDIMTTAGSVKMVRLSDSAFLLAWNPNNSNSWTMQVFTVSGNVITWAYTTTKQYGNYGSGYDNALAFGPAQQSIAFIPLGDNVVLINQTAAGYYSGYPSYTTQDIRSTQLKWTGSSFTTLDENYTFGTINYSALGWGYNVYSDIRNPWLTLDVYYVTRPGTDKVYQVFRGVPSTTPKTDATGYQRCYYRTLTKPANANNPWIYGSFKSLPDNFDLAFADNQIQVLSNMTMSYFLSDAEAGGNPTNYQKGNVILPARGGGYHSNNVGADALATPFTMVFDSNYHAVLDRRHFVDPTQPLKMKVIRREDSNIIRTSPASTGDFGFTVNVSQVGTFWDKPRPMMIGGDIVWFGVSGNNFAYNIIKQPPLPTN